MQLTSEFVRQDGRRRGALRARWALAAGCGLLMLAGCEAGAPDTTAADEPELSSDQAKASYSLGFRFAENVAQQFGDDVDSESFVLGVRDRLDDNAVRVDDAEAERVLTAMIESREAEAEAEALGNLDAGLRFLEENAERDDVVSLESGLQYEVLEEGEGEKPAAEDMVTTHYEGRLIDGTVFDSSYQRGEPASFPLNRVIPGWTEGLQLMSPGAKYRLYVPPSLAYGDRSAGTIPPNSTLVFDVELLEVGAPPAGDGPETGAADSGSDSESGSE